MKQPKILVWDIESLPNYGYFFQMFSDRGIPLAFVLKPKAIVTIAYKFLGDKKAKVLIADSPYDDKSIIEEFAKIWVQADYTVAHFGDGFDNVFLHGRTVANGLAPLPEIPSIDTYKLAKKHFGRTLNSNKLDHLGEILGVGNKNKTDASLWVRCAQGEQKALREMAAYNVQDVELLEQVLVKLLPYCNSKLNRNLFKDETQLNVICDVCGSPNLQKRGIAVTKSTKKQRLQCTECGHWQTGKLGHEKEEPSAGKTSKNPKPIRKGWKTAPQRTTKA